MDILLDAERVGVETIVVTEMPSSFQRLRLMLGERANTRLALGCHPLRAGQVTVAEKALFSRLIDYTDFIGEIGLDGSAQGRNTLPTQRRVLDFILSHPRVNSKVLTVHSRGAEEETIARLASTGVTAILHWYTGALKHIPTAVDAGMWFSVNPAMVRSQKGKKTIAALPKSRVITETDGPFAQLDGRPCVPADVPDLVAALARMWDEDVDTARERIARSMATLTAATQASDTSVVPSDG